MTLRSPDEVLYVTQSAARARARSALRPIVETEAAGGEPILWPAGTLRHRGNLCIYSPETDRIDIRFVKTGQNHG
jgi:hypothetical protein